MNRILKFCAIWIAVLGLDYYLAFSVLPDNHDQRWEVKSGVVVVKMVLQSSRSSSSPYLGMRFDDGSERDVLVTIALYSDAKLGDRFSFRVRKTLTAGKELLGIIKGTFIILFVFVSIILFLIHLSWIIFPPRADRFWPR